MYLFKFVVMLWLVFSIAGCDPNDCGFPIGKSCSDDPKCCATGTRAEKKTPATASYSADCLCRLSNSYLNAHFYKKPFGFKPKSGDTVKIRAQGCEYLSVCGSGNALSGYTYMRIDGWNNSSGQIYEFVINGDEVQKPRSQLLIDENQQNRVAAAVLIQTLLKKKESTIPRSIKVQFTDDPLDCRNECEGGGFNCTDALGKTIDLGEPLKEIYTEVDKLTSGGGILSQQQLIQLFDIQDDPCNRSDTFFASDSFTNTGELCQLSTEIALESGSSLPVHVDIPEKMIGDVSGSGSQFKIEFTEPDHAPTVVFEDDVLNAQYGGVMQTVEASENRVLFGLTTSCIKFTL